MAKKNSTVIGIIKGDTMEKDLRYNTDRTFETAPLLGAAHVLTTPVRAVHHAANPPSCKTSELQGQMNKWIVLALSATASFMTTLYASK